MYEIGGNICKNEKEGCYAKNIQPTKEWTEVTTRYFLDNSVDSTNWNQKSTTTSQ